ncbi:MAG: hypothetical protein L0J73_08905 [Halomonas sp.]|nr:hypothetical protein [Halomonas sp.]
MKRSGQQFKARFNADVKAWIEEKARKEDRSQTWIINHYLEKAMRNEAKKLSSLETKKPQVL